MTDKTPKSFRDTVSIHMFGKTTNQPCKFIAGSSDVWAITGEPKAYRLTHAPTGHAAGPRFRTMKEVTEYHWGLMAGVPVASVDSPDIRTVEDALRDNYTRLQAGVDVYVTGPHDEQSVDVTVTNVHTGEQVSYSVSSDDLVDGNHCTGPCECSIEPDGVCPEGWPGTEDALARC